MKKAAVRLGSELTGAAWVGNTQIILNYNIPTQNYIDTGNIIVQIIFPLGIL